MLHAWSIVVIEQHRSAPHLNGGNVKTPELLTVDEAADYLRIAPGTLYNWRHAGRGPKATNVGRSLRYRRTDLEAWLDSLATTAA
jgi:excisionase family DNA binding protein